MNWMHKSACALALVLVVGCGSETNTPGNIPIVVQAGRFADDATTTAAAATPDATTPSSLETAVLPGDSGVLDATETMLDATVEPTRTLTDTLEELSTPVAVDTAVVVTPEAQLADANVGKLRVTLRGVRVAALNASLIAPGDNHVLVVEASFENTTESPVLLQVSTDFLLRDAAGNQYTTEFVARASAQAREPDTLVPVGGSVQGEIAYIVPNAVSAFTWVVNNNGQQVMLNLPDSMFVPPEATASVREGTGTTVGATFSDQRRVIFKE